MHFGWGTSKTIARALPRDIQRVALLRGVKGLPAHSIRQKLEDVGLTIAEVVCEGEPSVISVIRAVEDLSNQDVQCVVAVGGGSVIDAGKAIAFCLGKNIKLSSDFGTVPAADLSEPGPIPCIAVPTTAGTGAEVTANAVLEIPERDAKVSLRGRALFPDVALVDPALLKSAPRSVVLASGLDAVVQTIEAYTSCAANPFSDALTAPNIELGLKALKQVLEPEPSDKYWEDLAWVSVTSGLALANSGLGAAHGIASILGGRYKAPHGALCGRLLVPVLRKNLEKAEPESVPAGKIQACITRIGEAFSEFSDEDWLASLETWQSLKGLPRLRDFDVQQEDFPSVADASAEASSSKKNAVPLTPRDFVEVLELAY